MPKETKNDGSTDSKRAFLDIFIEKCHTGEDFEAVCNNKCEERIVIVGESAIRRR